MSWACNMIYTATKEQYHRIYLWMLAKITAKLKLSIVEKIKLMAV
jgi:predicted transposase YdaD